MKTTSKSKSRSKRPAPRKAPVSRKKRELTPDEVWASDSPEAEAARAALRERALRFLAEAAFDGPADVDSSNFKQELHDYVARKNGLA